jgi:hypothetical protein
MGQPTRDARSAATDTSQQAQAQLAPVIQGNQQQQQTNLSRATSDYNAANTGLDTASGSLAKAGTNLDTATGTLGTAGNTLGSAGSTYQNFANTGGFDAAAQANYLNRATSGVTNTGTALEQQAKQAQSKSGGAGTGGQISQIARQLGQTQADSTNQAQMNLNQQMNANKLSGASGLNQVGQSQTGVGNAQTSVGQAQTGIGQAQTSVAQAHSLLFDANTNAASDLGKQVLAAYGIQYQTENQATQLLSQMANNPGIMAGIQQVAGMVGGAMAAV